MRHVVIVFALLLSVLSVRAQDLSVTSIASGLQDPRGVAVRSDGRLLLVEAGRGDDPPGKAVGSGQISLLDDLNGDGDYDDAGERQPLATNFPSYNSLNLFRTGHDEVLGLSDIVLLPDGRVFFTQDDPFHTPGHRGTDAFYGNTGIFELSEQGPEVLVNRRATLNAFVYDPQRQVFYVTESGLNDLLVLSLAGEEVKVIDLPDLAHGQQPVPAGIALDPLSGDVLIALLSGFDHDYYGGDLAFMPGDAKILRVNPDSGTIEDAVTGLTTAVDVTTDPQGNIYVVEMTTVWPPAFMPYDFDLYAPDAPPDAGGYARYTGRVTMFPADGAEARVLAQGLDLPTNITYAEGRLYVSTGQGTPGRSIITPDGPGQIDGVLYMISGF